MSDEPRAVQPNATPSHATLAQSRHIASRFGDSHTHTVARRAIRAVQIERTFNFINLFFRFFIKCVNKFYDIMNEKAFLGKYMKFQDLKSVLKIIIRKTM